MSAMKELDNAVDNVYNKVYPIEGSNMTESFKNWQCPKCEAKYQSPIKLVAVLCTTCSRKANSREQWMKPSN